MKKQGKKLGSPQNLTDEARKKAWQANHQKAQNNENNRRASGYIKKIKDSDMTYQAIADRLNFEGFRTARGKYFTPTAVRRLYIISNRH